MADHQVIVVGAGMGGLASAARLAHAGLSVRVVEAAGHPGGKMRSLPSVAGPVDAGPTVLTMRNVFDELFEDLDARLEDYVTLESEPVLARHFWGDGTRLDLFSDTDASAEAIAAWATPRDAAEFRRFARRARALFAAFEAPMMRNAAPTAGAMARVIARQPGLLVAMAPGLTMARQLARSFTDPRLRQLFGRYATYVGGSPYGAPALLSLIWQAEAAGVWRAEGGMSALARGLAQLARDRGATLDFDTPVSRILTRDGRIDGVELGDGTWVRCDTVLFNGDPRALSLCRLGLDVADAVAPTSVEPRSLSAEVWAFAAVPKGAELAHHNVFFGADPRSEFDAIAAGEPPQDPAIYVCAQDRGSGRARVDGPERFEIIVNAAPNLRPQEYAECHQRTFATLAARGLTFTPEPDETALTTPRDFERMFPGSEGALYGRSPAGMMAAFARPTTRTRVPGLYLAGGGAHPGAGVPMATLSGRHAAEAILSDRTST